MFDRVPKRLPTGLRATDMQADDICNEIKTEPLPINYIVL